MPNQSTKSGTHARDGIGIKTLRSGENIFSVGREVPISMPRGMAIKMEIPMPTSTRNKVVAVWTKIAPSSVISPRRLAMEAIGGVNAKENIPLLANASHMIRAKKMPPSPSSKEG